MMCMFVLCYLFSMIDAFIHPFQKKKLPLPISVPFGFLFVRSRFFCVLAFERIFLMFLLKQFRFSPPVVRYLYKYIKTFSQQTQSNVHTMPVLASIRSGEILLLFFSLTRTGNDSHFSNNKDMKRHNLMRVASDETQLSLRKNYED